MQWTSRSAGAASRTGSAPSSAASRSRPLGRAVPDPHLRAPASRSAHTAARALPPAPSTSALRPATANGSAAISAGASVLSAWIEPSAPNTSVFAAPIARARAVGSVGQRQRRLLVRDRHVRAAEPGAGQRAHGLLEQLRRHREQAVAPVAEPGRPQRGVLHRRRAAVADRPAEHAEAAVHSRHAAQWQNSGERPPRWARAVLVARLERQELGVGRLANACAPLPHGLTTKNR